MSDWKEYKLGETLVSANTGLDAIKRAPIVSHDTGIKCLRIQDISQSKSYEDWGFTEVLDNNFIKFKLLENDIIVARTGATVGVNMIVKKNLNSVFNNGLIRLRAKNEFNSRFVYYILRSNDYWSHINSIAFGTTSQPNIQINQLLSFKIKAPDFLTQASIAEILSSLDDKIELNNKINQELESLAQLLFKRWFVDFEFPNENGEPYKSFGGEMVDSEMGEIPKGWNVNIIESLTLKMNSGGTPSTRRNDFYDGNIKWFSTKELQDGFLFESDRKITIEGLNNSSAKLFPSKTVVMAIYAAPTVGRLGILSEEAAFNQAALGFVAKEEVGYEFIYLLLKLLRDDLNNLANGAAQQNLNVGLVKNFKIIYPTNTVLSSFQSIIRPIFKYLYQNQIESNSLIKTRDTLLPKLISGELQINDN